MILTFFFRLFPAFTSLTSHLYSLIFLDRMNVSTMCALREDMRKVPADKRKVSRASVGGYKGDYQGDYQGSYHWGDEVSIIFIIKSVLVTIEVSISTKLWIATAGLGWNWNQSDLAETKVEQAKTDLGSICFHQSQLILLPLSFSNFFELDTNYFRFGVCLNFNKHSDFGEFTVFFLVNRNV